VHEATTVRVPIDAGRLLSLRLVVFSLLDLPLARSRPSRLVALALLEPELVVARRGRARPRAARTEGAEPVAHRTGVNVLARTCSSIHFLTAGGPPWSIMRPSGTCARMWSVSSGSARRTKVRERGREAHLEEPQVVVGDLGEHVAHLGQLKVAAAQLHGWHRGEKMGIRHGAQEGPLQVGGVRASERERRGTHEKIDAGDLRVENYAAVLSGERAISFWRESERARGRKGDGRGCPRRRPRPARRRSGS